MTAVIVTGAQWGDEGKGKVVDVWTEHADAVVRFGGGANAGHTLVVGDGEPLVTHLVPSGVLHRGVICALGSGMVIDPRTLRDEIAACQARGLLADGELAVSERAHVILPYHGALEGLRESGARAIGTTRRGIGPAYEAKAARRGIRMRDLLRPARLRELVAHNLDEIRPLVAHYRARGGGGDDAAWLDDPAAVDAMIADALALGEALAPHLCDADRLVSDAIAAGKNVLFEGAQGALLDIDHGTYPYVTSSTTTAAGACHGTGVGPTRIDGSFGITKAYLTRVGGGPMPTEIGGDDGEALRRAGGEYGATTGRPRRCGWLDIPALRLAARLGGLDGLAVTKLDVLGGRDRVQVCVAYRLDGRTVDELPVDPEDIERAEPVYETFPGWGRQGDAIGAARSLDDLPAAARDYVRAMEELIGVPACLVSVGAERGQTIELRDPFASPSGGGRAGGEQPAGEATIIAKDAPARGSNDQSRSHGS